MERIKMKLLQIGPADGKEDRAMKVSIMPNGLQAWVALPKDMGYPDSESFSCILKGLALRNVMLLENGSEVFSPDSDTYFSHLCGRIMRWEREAGNEQVLRTEVRSKGLDFDIFVDTSLLKESAVKQGKYLKAYIFQYADFQNCVETE